MNILFQKSEKDIHLFNGFIGELFLTQLFGCFTDLADYLCFANGNSVGDTEFGLDVVCLIDHDGLSVFIEYTAALTIIDEVRHQHILIADNKTAFGTQLFTHIEITAFFPVTTI